MNCGTVIGRLNQTDCGFDNNGGNLFLPSGSNQDVDIAILTSGGSSEQHPNNVADLFNPNLSILPSIIDNIATPVFWYVGTGHKSRDEFFVHGGAFGTFYVDRVDAPADGQVNIKVEHSRDLQVEVDVTQDLPGLGLPITSTFKTPLPKGTDNLVLPSGMGWTAGIAGLHVTVILRDTSLPSGNGAADTHRNTFKRTFDFSGPGSQQL